MHEKKGNVAILLTIVLVSAFIIGGYIYWEKHLLDKVGTTSWKVENHKGKTLSVALLSNKQIPEINDDDEEEAKDSKEEEISEDIEESVTDPFTDQSVTTEVYSDNSVSRFNNHSTYSPVKKRGQVSKNNEKDKTDYKPKDKSDESNNEANNPDNPDKANKPIEPPQESNTPKQPDDIEKSVTDSKELEDTSKSPAIPIQPAPDLEEPKEP
ncbi:hypothetical protein [Bacillus sp. FSL K6-3431]|uniref:hypothetical protein n=1 Tax=Bacillus sp. FSL K6-3431 TaxID=2921500 RepID=UPI0030F9989A